MSSWSPSVFYFWIHLVGSPFHSSAVVTRSWPSRGTHVSAQPSNLALRVLSSVRVFRLQLEGENFQGPHFHRGLSHIHTHIHTHAHLSSSSICYNHCSHTHRYETTSCKEIVNIFCHQTSTDHSVGCLVTTLHGIVLP